MWKNYCSAGKQQDQLEEKRERTAQQGGGGGGQRLQAPVTDMKAPPLRFKFSSCQFLNLCQICWGACSSQLYQSWLFEKFWKIRTGFIGPDEGDLLRGVDWLRSSEQADDEEVLSQIAFTFLFSTCLHICWQLRLKPSTIKMLYMHIVLIGGRGEVRESCRAGWKSSCQVKHF